jgi:hypothetical protein
MQRSVQKDRNRLFALVVLALLLASQPPAWTQYPQVQPPPLAGSTLGQNLRNAAVATQNQLTTLRTTADNWSRRAASVNYTEALLQQDLNNVLWNFQNLRMQFNYLGQLALQLGRPTVDNAVAELDAGLNIIAELFVFLGDQYAAGTLDRATVVRTARIFHRAISGWERELKKNSSRLGLAW